MLDIGYKNDNEFVPAFLSSLIHQMTQRVSELVNSDILKKCTVFILEKVALHFQTHQKIWESALTVYNQQLFRTGTNLVLDKLMLASLGRIAAATSVSDSL